MVNKDSRQRPVANNTENQEMFQPSAACIANDVTIRCRIRRSTLATKNNFRREPVEMTCTLRNWETRRHNSLGSRLLRAASPIRRSSSSASNPDKVGIGFTEKENQPSGPELLLTPISEFLSNRDDSPQRRSVSFRDRRRVSPSKKRKECEHLPPPTQFSILVSEIMVVDTCNVHLGVGSHTLYITTLSVGHLECDCLNSNGHDILLAFLQASLPSERFLDGGAMQKSKFDSPPAIPKANSNRSCLDVDGLIAQHVQGRIDNETWPEKISRRMGKVVHSLSEISGALWDAACCQDSRGTASAESRDMPESSSSSFPVMEMDHNECDSTCSPRGARHHHHHHHAHTMTTTTTTMGKPISSRTMWRVPSGLSVEPDPEMDARTP